MIKVLCQFLCVGQLLYAIAPDRDTPAENRADGPTIAAIAHFDRDQLLAYVAGLDLPDNLVRSLYPSYLAQRAHIDNMNAQGLGDTHRAVAPELEKLAILRIHLDKACDALDLQSILDLDGQRVAEATRSVPRRLFLQSVKRLKPAELEREKVQLDAILEALHKLHNQSLLVFAAGLEVWQNKSRVLYLDYMARMKIVREMIDSGIDSDNQKLIEQQQDVARIRKQLDEQVVVLIDNLQGRLKSVTAALVREHSTAPKKAEQGADGKTPEAPQSPH